MLIHPISAYIGTTRCWSASRLSGPEKRLVVGVDLADETKLRHGLPNDADLGLADADELWTRVRLAASINAILAARKLTQVKAAEVLGVNQPKISALRHYKLEGFSVERLMHFATALEHDVVIEIRPRAKAAKKGRILVVGAA